jgi:carbamoyl-phosphate synthase large subunit
MRSTGEVLGMAQNYGLAFYKAQEAANARLPLEGTVLFTIADNDKHTALEAARHFSELGFNLRATDGTCRFLASHGIAATSVKKLHEGRPNLVDAIKNGEVQLLVNTPAGRQGTHDDSYLRKAAIGQKIPYITTAAAAVAAARGIAARRPGSEAIRSLQEYHRDLD